MFNSPALDIGLGLIFIFLLYSLLATSIQEAIATAFNLRAVMLKKSIVENMLADTPDGAHLSIWLKQCAAFIRQLPVTVGIAKKKKDASLGGRFYDHPLIKNYGESRMFPIPSYIPTKNFSAVLLDILLKDFNTNLDAIAAFKKGTLNDDITDIKEQLQAMPLTYKIKELLAFHLDCYERSAEHKYFLECDTCRILEMHLRNSLYDVQAFSKRLEGWFDDSMRRVSGWYKRKSQFILFVIGMGMAFVFNIDILQISGKLSTDKDARDKLVAMAVDAADKYKDDPRVQGYADSTAANVTSMDSLKSAYKKHTDDAKKLLKGDINDTNHLLALGWNEFGRHDANYLLKLKKRYAKELNYDSIAKTVTLADPVKRDSTATDLWYLKVKEKHPVKVRTGYIITTLKNNPRSLLGYLILAFSICLGAPFWFDLLGKMINIRGSGKKEAAATTAPSVEQAPSQPLQIAINNTNDGEEAVG